MFGLRLDLLYFNPRLYITDKLYYWNLADCAVLYAELVGKRKRNLTSQVYNIDEYERKEVIA